MARLEGRKQSKALEFLGFSRPLDRARHLTPPSRGRSVTQGLRTRNIVLAAECRKQRKVGVVQTKTAAPRAAAVEENCVLRVLESRGFARHARNVVAGQSEISELAVA